MEVIEENKESVRVPGLEDKVFKDECLYSMDTPESPTGLYICLDRWVGVGERFLHRYMKRSGKRIFLHIKRILKKTLEQPLTRREISPSTTRIDHLLSLCRGKTMNTFTVDCLKISSIMDMKE